MAWQAISPLAEAGETDTGVVHEKVISIEDEHGQRLPLHRVVLMLDHPTRDGETEIALLTNLPSEAASACVLADLYRSRWLIEGAFQEVAEHLSSEINTLGYPRAALFGFCVALVAANVLSVVKAALGRVHGTEKIEAAVSGYYLADEIAGTYRVSRHDDRHSDGALVDLQRVDRSCDGERLARFSEPCAAIGLQEASPGTEEEASPKAQQEDRAACVDGEAAGATTSTNPYTLKGLVTLNPMIVTTS